MLQRALWIFIESILRRDLMMKNCFGINDARFSTFPHIFDFTIVLSFFL